MAGNEGFYPVAEHGWRRGLGNLIGIENARWWKTRRWISQSITWVLIIDFILFMVMITEKVTGEGMPGGELSVLFSIFSGLSLSIGVSILMQGAIVGEKSTGTAAWVLSKPVSRTAFLLAKMISNSIGLVVTGIVVPGIVAYFGMRFLGEVTLSPINFISGLGILALNTIYWLVFTVALGTIFNSRGPVIGIPLGLVLGFQLITGVIPWIVYILPYQLAFPMGEETSSALATAMILGETPETWLPLVTAIVGILVMIGFSIWRLGREEF